jgi:hypothetical protein
MPSSNLFSLLQPFNSYSNYRFLTGVILSPRDRTADISNGCLHRPRNLTDDVKNSFPDVTVNSSPAHCLSDLPRSSAGCGSTIRRTMKGSLFLGANRPMIPMSNQYRNVRESSSALLRQAGRCSGFQPGRQFGYVSRRTGPPE